MLVTFTLATLLPYLSITPQPSLPEELTCGVVDRIEDSNEAVVEIAPDTFLDVDADPDWYEGDFVCFF